MNEHFYQRASFEVWLLIQIVLTVFALILGFWLRYRASGSQDGTQPLKLSHQLGRIARKPMIVFVSLSWLYLTIELFPWHMVLWHAKPETLTLIYERQGVLLELMWLFSISWGVMYFLRQWEMRLDEDGSRQLGEWIGSLRIVFMVARGIVYVIIVLTLLRIFELRSLADNLFTTGALSTVVIGLAARESIANIFGGMMVLFDRPFTVGDYILSSDKNVEGTVEKIGWRMTLVRTPERRLMFVPNNVFSTITIENLSKMSNRRLRFTVGIRYKDYRKIQAICEDIEAFCARWDVIDKRQSNFVTFKALNDYSMDIFINVYSRPLRFREYYRVIDQLLHQVVAIVHHHKADFPFPTTTLDADDMVAVLKQKNKLKATK